MDLKPGHTLTYIVSHEVLFPDKTRGPEIHIESLSGKGETDWELTFSMAMLGNEPCTRLNVLNDAYHVFAQVPELWAGLAEIKDASLDDIRALLDRIGAFDNTLRPEDAAATA